MKLVILVCLAALAFVAAAEEYKVVCYYTNWAQYRKNAGAGYFPEDLDPNLCTHAIFSFAYLKKGGVIGEREWNDLDTEWSKGMYHRFNDLKQKNPKLKTLLAVGGWNHPWELFSTSVATQKSRDKLNKSIVDFLRKWNFDGFDLDWEYPGNRGSPAGDKQKFTLWCKDLRAAFEAEAKKTGKERLLLSAAVGAGKSTVDAAYEIGKIAHSLDFINLMAYDLHGQWEKTVNNHSPLKSRSSETGANAYLNVEWATRYWKDQIVKGGSPSTKLILGLPTYGRSFTLASGKNGPLAPAKQGGTAGSATKEAGFLAYFEICDMIKKGGKRVWDSEQQYPYVYKGNQWVGYDDQESLKLKIDFIKKEGLGGGMFWALDLDDFKGNHCGQGKYPLISYVAKGLRGATPEPVIPTAGPTEATTKRPSGGKGKKKCKRYQKLVKGKCVPKKKCRWNQKLVRGRCAPKCKNGKKLVRGKCILKCKKNMKFYRGKCIPKWKDCKKNEKLVKGKCVNKKAGEKEEGGKSHCPKGHDSVRGRCIPKGWGK